MSCLQLLQEEITHSFSDSIQISNANPEPAIAIDQGTIQGT